MRIKQKTAILAIVLAMLFLAACAQDTDYLADQAVTPDISAAVADEEAEPEEVSYLDILPIDDFDGHVFRILAQHTDARPNFPGEEETGEVLNDALIRRNRIVEERLNISILNIGFEDRGVVRSNLMRSVAANDNEYDMIITSKAEGINTLAPSGALFNLDAIEHLQLEADWWSATVYRDLQVNGNIFYTTGPLSPFFYYTPVVFAFNKRHVENFALGNMYEMVRNNEWTADRLEELKRDMNADINGDGIFDSADFFGLAHDGGVTGQAMFTAFGQNMAVRDADTHFRLNMDTPAALSAIERAASILSDPASTFNGAVASFAFNSELPLFVEGRAMFLITTMNNVIELFRGMEDDYGIIPLPKLNQAQETFNSFGNPWGPSGIAVPIYTYNTHRTGLIMETMAYLSYQMVRPALYDNIIHQRVARNEETQGMLDIIYSNVHFDLNAIHNFGGSAILLREAGIGIQQNFVSAFEALRDIAERQLNDLIEAYLELD